jgi:hypothetical protein
LPNRPKPIIAISPWQTDADIPKTLKFPRAETAFVAADLNRSAAPTP